MTSAAELAPSGGRRVEPSVPWLAGSRPGEIGGGEVRRRAGWAIGSRVAIVCVIALSQTPLLRAFFIDLGNRENYTFYPLLLLAAGWLAWDRVRQLPAGRVRPGGRWVVGSLLFLALVASVSGSIFYARLLAAIAAGLTGAAAIWHVGGRTLARAMLPVGIILLVIVPPPGRLDASLLRMLQTVAVSASARTLDLMGIPRFVSGTIIEIPGHQLLVEEACSGLNSLMAVVAFSLFYGFLARRNAVRLAALLTLAVFFVLWVNVLRIVLGAVMLAWFDVNLLDPSVHELTGIILWGFALGLVLSADQLIGWIAGRLATNCPRNLRSSLATCGIAASRGRSRICDAVTPKTPPQSPQNSSGQPNTQRETGRAAEPTAASTPAFRPRWGSLACGSLAAAFFAIGVFSYARTNECWQPSRLDGAATFEPPAEIAGWRLASENAPARRLQSVGRYQNHWFYRRGEQVGEVSFAYPFAQGYHDATECYVYAGWKVQSKEAVRPIERAIAAPNSGVTAMPDVNALSAAATSTQAPFCFVADLAGPVEGQAQLLFAAFAEDGTWQSPPTEPYATGNIARALQLSRDAALRKPACEVQTLGVFERPEGPTNAERAALAELFNGVREALRLQTLARVRQK